MNFRGQGSPQDASLLSPAPFLFNHEIVIIYQVCFPKSLNVFFLITVYIFPKLSAGVSHYLILGQVVLAAVWAGCSRLPSPPPGNAGVPAPAVTHQLITALPHFQSDARTSSWILRIRGGSCSPQTPEVSFILLLIFDETLAVLGAVVPSDDTAGSSWGYIDGLKYLF